MIGFLKYQATGNDFVIVADLDDTRPFTALETAAICDRRRGVGADGLIRVVRAHGGEAPYLMDYANADGSVAEMCGNGIRCVGVMLHDLGLAPAEEFGIATRAGTRQVRLHRDPDGAVRRVTIGMGTPKLSRGAIPMLGAANETFLAQPLELQDGDTVTASAVSMGNPHLVVFVDGDLEAVRVSHIGPELERHDLFPEHTNVEFAGVRDGVIEARVWERGSGETMACGSGACAVAVVANESGRAPTRSVVRFPGGDLEVERSTDGPVLLTGEAHAVFSGELPEPVVAVA